jgi:hypothetical protein
VVAVGDAVAPDADVLVLAPCDAVAGVLALLAGVLALDEGVAAALAAAALAPADGSSALGVLASFFGLFGVFGVLLLPIDPAKAVRCVRTSWSLPRVVSSSVAVADLPDGLVPVVPAAGGVVAPVVPSAPSSSVRIRSAAATSFWAAALSAVAEDDFPRFEMCRFNSATLLFVVPVSDAAGISFKAVSA